MTNWSRKTDPDVLSPIKTSVDDGPATDFLTRVDDLLGASSRGAPELVVLQWLLEPRRELRLGLPARWLGDLLAIDPGSDQVLLCQAGTLCVALGPPSPVPRDAPGRRDKSPWERRLDDHETRLIRRLITLSLLGPSSRSSFAHQLTAQLAERRPRPVIREVTNVIRDHPLGFRAWRIFSTWLHLRGDAAYSLYDEAAVQALTESTRLRTRSLYPARCLDIEALLHAPTRQTEFDTTLEERAADPECTPRERTLAALALLQRAVTHGGAAPGSSGSRAGVTATAATVADLGKKLAHQAPERSELEWSALVLAGAAENEDVTYIPPGSPQVLQVEELARKGATRTIETIAWRAHDDEFTKSPYGDYPGLPDAFTYLVVQAVLQSHGVYRRHAIETLRAAQAHHWAVPVFCEIMEDDSTPLWMVSRAAFALGLSGVLNEAHGSRLVAALDRFDTTTLAGARDAPPSGTTDHDGAVRRQQHAEYANALHTVLFAIGDAYGSRRGRQIRPPRQLARHLAAIIGTCTPRDQILRWPLRAAAYCTARITGLDDRPALLDALGRTTDSATIKLVGMADTI